MTSLTIPSELASAINNGECVLFIASGFSSQVLRNNGKKLPNWSEFLSELLEWSIEKQSSFNGNPSEIQEMITKGNLLMAAEELQEVINTSDLNEFLNNVFRDSNVKPSQAHLLLTKIPFRAILSTNYDTLIEGAYAISSGGQIPKKLTNLDLNQALPSLNRKEFFVFKLHGDIDRHENIVLGSRAYNSLLYQSPAYLNFLETLFTTQTVLFVGFGGNDPDIDYLLNRLSTIYSRTSNKHYILAPDNSFNFTEKRRLLLDKRLVVLEYNPTNNHEQVREFLSLLSQLQSEKKRQDKVDNIENNPTNVAIIKHEITDSANDKLVIFIESLSDFNLSMLFSYSAVFDAEYNEDWMESFNDEDYYHVPSIALIILSQESLTSISFNREVERLILQNIEDKVTIIPIVIGDIDIPFNLRKYQIIRIHKDYDKADLEYIKAALIRAQHQNSNKLSKNNTSPCKNDNELCKNDNELSKNDNELCKNDN